jgi:small-conductance mechanosensitive channel
MLRLDQRQRLLLADKLFDVGNLAAGALVFGQFLGERVVSRRIVGAGLLTWIVLLAFSAILARETRR